MYKVYTLTCPKIFTRVCANVFDKYSHWLHVHVYVKEKYT